MNPFNFNKISKSLVRILLYVLVLQLSACGGGGGGPTTRQMGGAIQGVPLSLSTVVSTFAGAPRGADGIGSAARFNELGGVVTDGAYVYVADNGNHTIRRVVIATGAVTTLAGTVGVAGSADGTAAAAQFNYPTGITIDNTHTYLYVTDSWNYTIRRIVIATGAVTTLAGSAGSSGSADGTGSAARFNATYGVVTDGTNLYVTDTWNHTIRRIVTATGAVTTLAGTAGVAGTTDGTGSAARFNSPFGITTDGANLYVADYVNNTIRQIVIATGAVTTIAGTAGVAGSVDGSGTAARFYYPNGITTDGTNLYVADLNNNTIRQIAIATKVVTTIAGLAGAAGSTDGIGGAARFNGPFGIATNGINLFVSDSYNHTIRQIGLATNAVATIAGMASASADGIGGAAQFYRPYGITTDGANLYVADTLNHTIRQIVIATGAVTTIAGTAGVVGSVDGTGAVALFNYPVGITTDGTNLYVADTGNNTIRQIVIATGAVTTLAGSAGVIGSADGIGIAARFRQPEGITTDGTNLYVADRYNHTIRQIVIATGAVTTIAGSAGSSGSTDGTGAAARFFFPDSITTDGLNLYIADTSNETIRRIVIATGAVTTIAGTAGELGSVDGIGAAARFGEPSSITTDGTSLYVTDSDTNTIRRIVITTGAVTTLAGTAGNFGSTDGAGNIAQFYYPMGITTDGHDLFIADSNNNTVRRLQ